MTDPATPTIAHPIPSGSKVKVTGRDEAWEAEGSDPTPTIGAEYVVAYYVPAEDAEDSDRSFYYLDPLDGHSIGGTYPVLVEHVEVTKSAEDMDAVNPPTAYSLLADYTFPMFPEGYDVNEADAITAPPDAPAPARRFHGMTDDGVRFGYTLTVSDVERED